MLAITGTELYNVSSATLLWHYSCYVVILEKTIFQALLRDLKRCFALFAALSFSLSGLSSVISFRCVSRNSIGESSTTLHLIVRPQMGVSVEPDLLVADFGSQAEFTCKIYAQDDRPTPSKSCQSSHTV